MLVIDDDPTVSEVVCRYLRAAGFTVDEALDGLSGLHLAEQLRPDLVVLDRMLPHLDGIEVCRRVRTNWAIPVIMLTALGEEEDRIQGLEAGADDYLVKPFSPRELVLRVQSVLRRSVPESLPEGVIEVGEFSLDLGAHEIRLRGVPLVLTSREFDLLAYLVWRPSKVLSREDLMRSVWGWEFGDLSTVTVHVRRLREKIEADPAHPRVLNTVWGVGYRFDPVALGATDAAPRPVVAAGPASGAVPGAVSGAVSGAVPGAVPSAALSGAGVPGAEAPAAAPRNAALPGSPAAGTP
ncbi:DNA-binding response regulator [Cryobacterium melibiosiphilum]|uniref:DNA-binding response regulator n=1 Tax=Cryobacterium melibiosiphilum TaxID=995039 RepID=A0A3A5MCI7_9MICO|nr:DNA-binding response regulator [Cryobacterium melibiosiphilum]